MSRSPVETPAAGPLVIYGAGGHGQVVAEAAVAAGLNVIGFFDDAATQAPADLPWPLLQRDDPRLTPDTRYIVGVGDNHARQRLMSDLARAGCKLASVIHPTAVVSPSATLGQGVFVGPTAVVHTAAKLADGVIVNSGAIVEHHVHIGPYTHIAPNVALGGAARVGELSLVGLNATVLPGLHVGNDCTVAAAAVVTRPIPDGRTVIGAPAIQQAKNR